MSNVKDKTKIPEINYFALMFERFCHGTVDCMTPISVVLPFIELKVLI